MSDLSEVYSERSLIFLRPTLKSAMDFLHATYGDSMRSLPKEQFGNCAVEPAIQRCIRIAVSVAMLGEEDWVVAAAILFDCVAAKGTDRAALSKAGFSDQVISTVMALQQGDKEPVSAYIARLAKDRATRVIKRADLCESLSSSDPDHFSSYRHVVALDMLVRRASSKYA